MTPEKMRAARRRSIAWLFEDYPEGTWLRQMQILNTTWLHMWTPIIWRPLRRLIRRR